LLNSGLALIHNLAGMRCQFSTQVRDRLLQVSDNVRSVVLGGIAESGDLLKSVASMAA